MSSHVLPPVLPRTHSACCAGRNCLRWKPICSHGSRTERYWRCARTPMTNRSDSARSSPRSVGSAWPRACCASPTAKPPHSGRAPTIWPGCEPTSLTAAASVLGLGSVSLHSYPDGHLTEVPVENLCARLDSFVDAGDFDCLLAFDEGGITGHPDHRQATTAARAVAHRRRLPLLAWTLTRAIADALNEEFRADFVGRELSEIDITLDVNRTVQRDAIACPRKPIRGQPGAAPPTRLAGQHRGARLARST